MKFQGRKALFLHFMQLEEEIKQRTFRNEYQKAALNLVYTTNWLLDRHQEFFDRYKITAKQYNVLRILKGQYPKSISTCEIRTRMLDKNSDASRIVDRLALRELVTKSVCSSDKRLVDVTISEKGIKLLDIIENHINDLDDLTSGLSGDEASALNNLLDKIRSRHSGEEKETYR